MESRSVKGLQSAVPNELFVVGAGEEDRFGDVGRAVAALSSSAEIYRSEVVATSDLSRSWPC